MSTKNQKAGSKTREQKNLTSIKSHVTTSIKNDQNEKTKKKKNEEGKDDTNNSKTTTDVTKNINKSNNVSKGKATSTSSLIRSKPVSQLSIPRNETLVSSKNSLSKRTTQNVKPQLKSDQPATHSSKRVIKTQYFPSKNLYASALKTKSKVEDVKTKSNSVLKSEIIQPRVPKDSSFNEIVLEPSSSDASSSSARPRTATLRKGSIVNANIVGPDAPRSTGTVEVPFKNLNEDNSDYDQDFDSYESDFDDYSSSNSTINHISEISTEKSSSLSDSSYTSPVEFISIEKRINSAGTDEERKLDSGNFDLSDYKRKQILVEMKESMEKDGIKNDHKDNNKSNLTSLSDEGFEEVRSLQFINFLGAKKKYQSIKSAEKRKKRGEEILNMIRLDCVSYTLFEIHSVPYEQFIKKFGRTNAIQVCTQTGEENLSEEIQTDEIVLNNMWTQMPSTFSKIDNTDANFWNLYKSELLGVGNDSVEAKKYLQSDLNEDALKKFIFSASQLVFALFLEQNRVLSENIKNNSRDIPFSDGYLQISTEKLLRNRKITFATFCLTDSNKFLSVHVLEKDDTLQSDMKSVVCTWNVNNITRPELCMTCFGTITCCAFGLEVADLLVGGVNNGMVVIWDTKETESQHKNVTHLDDGGPIMRSPTYVTEIGFGHKSRVISVQSFTEKGNILANLKFGNTEQICSIDENCEIILWSVIAKQQNAVNENQCLAHWGKLALLKNTVIPLKETYTGLSEVYCTDMTISSLDSNHMYIGTNKGCILHYLMKGGKSTAKIFNSETTSKINCLENCPFSPLYFLAGFENGNISLFSRLSVKPLITMSNKENEYTENQVKKIQWLPEKPCIFYTQDDKNTIDIWDLNQSNIFPTISIPFKETIVAMKISPHSAFSNKETETKYVMIATETEIYLHILKPEFEKETKSKHQLELQTFLNYVNRL